MSAQRIVKVIAPFVVLAVCLLIAYQVTQSQPPASKGRLNKAIPLLVEVHTIKKEPFQVIVESYGALKANTRTELLPLVSGQVVRVSESFQRGSFVRAGQVLLEIDPLEYEVAIQAARGDLASAELALAEEEARSEQALRDWQSQVKLKGAKARDFTLRYPQLKAAKANLESAKAKLRLAEENLERTKIRAPYDGRLIETFSNIGSVVSTSTKIAELYSRDSLELSLPISNRDLAFLDLPDQYSANQAARQLPVTIENELVSPPEYWQASIVGTEALVDAENQQIYALAKIGQALSQSEGEAGQALKLGQYLHARITGKLLEEAILVPNEAIYKGSYVYLVEDKDGEKVLSRRNIEVRWRNEEISLLKSGLAQGDLLVTTPLGQVTSGTRVRIDTKDKENVDVRQGAQP